MPRNSDANGAKKAPSTIEAVRDRSKGSDRIERQSLVRVFGVWAAFNDPRQFSQAGEFLCTAGRSGIWQFVYFASREQPLLKKMPDGNRIPSA